MSKELRWRVIALQVVMVVVLAFASGLAFWGSNFTNEQVKSQLAPQQIMMPAGERMEATVTEINEKYPDLAPYTAGLRKYDGQQVLTGDQAHVFAEGYLNVHVRDIDNGKPYSVLSNEARAEKDPALKAQKDANVQTAFRGESLRAMLNQAWAFSIFGSVSLFAGFALLFVTLIVLGSLVYELVFAKKPVEVQATAPNLVPSRA